MIVCATRGGEASQVAQDFAIQLARERGDELVFIYIADTRVLSSTSDTRPHDIVHDLTRMGEFILCIAEERARAAGAEKVSWECRLGAFHDELKQFLVESGADTLVLGRPVTQGMEQVFTRQGLDQFSADIQADIGIEVLLANAPEG